MAMGFVGGAVWGTRHDRLAARLGERLCRWSERPSVARQKRTTLHFDVWYAMTWCCKNTHVYTWIDESNASVMAAV